MPAEFHETQITTPNSNFYHPVVLQLPLTYSEQRKTDMQRQGEGRREKHDTCVYLFFLRAVFVCHFFVILRMLHQLALFPTFSTCPPAGSGCPCLKPLGLPLKLQGRNHKFVSQHGY